VKVGDLVKHYDQLYTGLGLVIDIASHPHRDEVDFVRVQYDDVTDWIDIEDLELVGESR